MQAIFGFQDVSEVIEKGLSELSVKAIEEKKRNYKILKIFNKISKATTTKEIWDILVKTYGDGDKNKKVKLQTLRRQFEVLTMDEGETMAKYFDKVQELKLGHCAKEYWKGEVEKNKPKKRANLAQEEESDSEAVMLMASTDEEKPENTVWRKGEVLQVFQKFKCLVERHCGKKIKVLRTDGGAEYTSTKFKDFCEKEGIGEVVLTATYILNMSPTKRLDVITPEEAWTRVKLDVKHLKIFGSICYKHVPDQLRKKLDDKGVSLILAGYNDTRGYKLYDPISGTTYEPTVVESDVCRRDDSVRRSSRITQLLTHLRDYDLSYDATITSEGNFIHYALITYAEPVEFDQAIRDERWYKAMQEKIDSIEKNQTWILTELPPNKKPIALKWIYKSKINPQGVVIRHKARLVAKGFLQQAGKDYEEVFAPMARIETIRLALSPWNQRIDGFKSNIGFEKCVSEHGLYVQCCQHNDKAEKLIVCLYMDDLLITKSSEEKISDFKIQMLKEFEISDLGRLSYFLGIEFTKTDGGNVMHQSRYALDMSKRFDMLN
ncbi:uncharacterized protein LOC108346619 [Vigna angularis]|uniref:uncharacterized protein LOC108346619 n=1 Tax=Phaseolus angularis TaxID=3914 RepID=UPI000809D949|nr:uncharacterized protein LOC108346619 [Vigna angularis]